MTSPLDTPRRRISITVVSAVIAGVVAADQVTKSMAESAECGPVICSLRNDDLMLGIGGRQTTSTALLGCAGLVIFIVYARALVRRGVPAVPIAMVFAGIVSNIIDRVALGGVRDFVSGPSGIVFNGADVAILAGLCACVVAALRSFVSAHWPTTDPGRR